MRWIKLISVLFSILGLTVGFIFPSSASTINKIQKPSMRLMLLGAPGAGKGTQADLLAQKFNIPHIATGDMLRTEIAQGTILGLSAKKIMDAGGLVSDDIIFAMVQKRLKQPDCIKGYILDGFPRNLTQAELLKSKGIYFDHVIEIQVDDNEIIKRVSGRRLHQPSGRIYHIVYNPPKVPGKDDITGQRLIQREDDKEETVKKRIALYHEQTEPLIKFYDNWSNSDEEGAPQCHKILGTKTVNQIFNNIMNAVS